MSASKDIYVTLGDYIEQCDERNSDGKYTIDDAMGMTITKEIIPTKADLKDKIANIKATAEAALKQSDYETDKKALNTTISGINTEITGVKNVIGSGKFDATNTITKYAAGVDGCVYLCYNFPSCTKGALNYDR